MAFHFSLDSVLRFRESLEQREEVVLLRIQQELAEVRNAIDQITADIANAEKAREQALQQPIPAARLQAMLCEKQAALEHKKNLLASLQALEQKRTEQMKIYQAAHRGRRMLTEMESRQLDAYEQERARDQQKFLDDVFGARHQRG